MRATDDSVETTERTTRANPESCSYPQDATVVDIEDHRAKLIERMEAERAFVAPLFLLPVRCVCGSATFAADGLCPECRKP